ncbi:MAG: hypothetical protein RBT63_00280 [Bdellovibrionales bacterium]|jgi:hypothetical protein|nr:hypothetical protein [Bdellovibrionales bacterium]
MAVVDPVTESSCGRNQTGENRRWVVLLFSFLFFVSATTVSVLYLVSTKDIEEFHTESSVDVTTAIPDSDSVMSREATADMVSSDPMTESMDVIESGLTSASMKSVAAGKQTSQEVKAQTSDTSEQWPELRPERQPDLQMQVGRKLASVPEVLKIDTNGAFWNGAAQLLPNPLYVAQLGRKGFPDIRGGGWMAIDIARSEIVPVELFKAPISSYAPARLIEAKYMDGRPLEIMNGMNTGFPVFRGLSGLVPGRFEVVENPPCLVRYAGVLEDEICRVRLSHPSASIGNVQFKFEAPKPVEGVAPSEYPFSKVYVLSLRGQWREMASFNESFHPIGDPNRDGYPDFYVESVFDDGGNGQHVLLLSYEADDSVGYKVYRASFYGVGE